MPSRSASHALETDVRCFNAAANRLFSGADFFADSFFTA